MCLCLFFFFQAEDGIRDLTVTGVQTCALPIWSALRGLSKPSRWRFFVKNSETEISRWRAPISTAEAVVAGLAGLARSEERRVGEEGRSRWSPYHLKKKKRSK